MLNKIISSQTTIPMGVRMGCKSLCGSAAVL